jgi:hypothetical protein
MNPEVETILNELRENKRKQEEEKAIREKCAEEAKIIQENERKNKINNFIQSNKNKWEAEELFCKENGKSVWYSDLTCPICNTLVSYSEKLTDYEERRRKELARLGNVKYKEFCQSCNEIIVARDQFYQQRLKAEESRKQAEEARLREEQARRNAEEQKKKTEEKIVSNNEKFKQTYDKCFVKHTFSGFVYGKPCMQYLALTNYTWIHNELSDYGDTQQPCTKGMNPEWKNYYAEGKVPFITVCPECNELMKIQYRTVHAECFHAIHNDFTEVSCPNGHYKYDSKVDKHYKWKKDPPREPLLDSFGRNIDYRPIGLGGQWVFWDPTDPDGIRAEAERRKKHNEDIYKQIETLRSKLLPE